MRTTTLTLPTFWVCALFYGDYDGLEHYEVEKLASFVADTIDDLGRCEPVDVGEDSFFATYHDATAYGIPACDVQEVTFATQ